MSCRALGVHIESWGPSGEPLTDEVGELVVRAPFPSMPLYIWGDDDGSRYKASYFEHYPGVWRQGDWLTLTARGTAIVHGRSDATLNRRGIRIGSADIYSVVEAMDEVQDSLVLGVELDDGGYWMPLFVVLRSGARLDQRLIARILQRLSREASPRHLPDEVIEAPGIPRTLTGKKLEVPLKRIAQGADPSAVIALDAVAPASAVSWFVNFLSAGRARPH
jgi:acetoacetyl-CoA synthetase